MIRWLVFIFVGLGLVAFFATWGEPGMERAADGLIAISAAVGATSTVVWRRYHGSVVTSRGLFRGAWIAALTLPMVLGVADGSSAGFIGIVLGVGATSGALLAALLATAYWVVFERSRICPHCAERVLTKARVCKHCKSVLGT